MRIVFWILIFLGTFSFMEFMAWFTHKYIMHGFLWSLHKDHHHKDHESWFRAERCLFYFLCNCRTSLIHAGAGGFWYGYPLGFGILAYGVAYFFVHDIFIHQRFKLFRNANHWYAKGVRRAHKIHHKHLGKKKVNASECFLSHLNILKNKHA